MRTELTGDQAWDMLAALPHAIVVANREGHILYANPAVESVLGWNPQTLVGQSVTTLTPPRLRGIHLTAFELYMQTGKEVFLSSVAHDLKSPLTSVKGFTQLLLRRARRDGELLAQHVIPNLERMEATIDRVVALVDELLDITRVRMGRSLDLVLRPCDFVQIVHETVEATRPGSHRQILLDANTAAIIGEWDASRLQRMLVNLLSNAVKYSPDGSTVHVIVRREEDLAVVGVHNEGIGIPVKDLPHIFDQFHRGSNVEGEVPGAGIGLASARHVVEHHGGAIEVESEEGKGATFTVRLPVHPVTEFAQDASP